MLNRRSLLGMMPVFAAPAFGATETYPAKPIRLVVPAGPGGGADLSARLLAQKISESTGQPVVVENIAGAGGIIGADKVAKSYADGYTVLFGINALMTMVAALGTKMPYRQTDFEPVGMVYRGGFLLLANPDVPARTFPELVALAKQQPGRIAFASTGNGSSGHLGMELIQQQAGIQLLHVPFKGPGIVELMANQVQLKLEPLPSGVPLVKGGKLRPIAFTGAERASNFPLLPTISETLRGYQLYGWQGIWVPRGTPESVINKLNLEFTKALATPELQSHMAEISASPNDSSIAAMKSMIASETALWEKLARERRLTAD